MINNDENKYQLVAMTSYSILDKIRSDKKLSAAFDHLAALESACTGVEFTGDPTGAVVQLIEALQPLAVIAELREMMPEFSWNDIIKDEYIRAARTALARVRIVDGGVERKEP